MPGLILYIAHGLLTVRGFPGGSDGEESGCSAGHVGPIPGSGRSPGEVFLPREFPGQRSLVDCSPWDGRVGHNWETNTFTFSSLNPSHNLTTRHQSHTHAKTGEARNRKIESISWLPWSKRWERGQCLVLILSLILLCIILSVFFLLWGLKTRFWNLSRLASTLDVRAGTVCRSLLSLFSPLRKWQKMALWPHLIATFLLLFKSPLSSSLFYLHLFL